MLLKEDIQKAVAVVAAVVAVVVVVVVVLILPAAEEMIIILATGMKKPAEDMNLIEMLAQERTTMIVTSAENLAEEEEGVSHVLNFRQAIVPMVLRAGSLMTIQDTVEVTS